jgi:hypothetical protein
MREAIARQHQPLLAVPQRARALPRGLKRGSVATKVTAGVALGFLGFWAGGVTAVVIANATHARGGGNHGFFAGGAIGAGAGAALGVWLASR